MHGVSESDFAAPRVHVPCRFWSNPSKKWQQQKTKYPLLSQPCYRIVYQEVVAGKQRRIRSKSPSPAASPLAYLPAYVPVQTPYKMHR